METCSQEAGSAQTQCNYNYTTTVQRHNNGVWAVNRVVEVVFGFVQGFSGHGLITQRAALIPW